MLDAATYPCFTILMGGLPTRVSLRDLLATPFAGATFAGPTPFLEATQLLVASAILADYAHEADNEADLDDLVADLIARIDAQPGRHRIDGDGPRYLQVHLPVASREEKDVEGIDGELFPNFGMMSKDDGKFNFGFRPHASQDGFCPSCALLGLNFVAKFSGGTGGKVSGPWKSGLLTFPTFTSLRTTIIVNALAWTDVGDRAVVEWTDFPYEVPVDPWADPSYTSEVARSGTFKNEFKSVPHLRALSPWAVWLQWEKKDGRCSLCGLPSEHLAVGAYTPKKGKEGWPGKLGWPKDKNAKGESVSALTPSPYTPILTTKTGSRAAMVPKNDLLSVAQNIFGSERAHALMDTDRFGPSSVLVAGILNDHKGAGSYSFTTHVPAREGLEHLATRCGNLHAAFEAQAERLRKGLWHAVPEAKPSPMWVARKDAALTLFQDVASDFVPYTASGPHAVETWEAHLRARALHIYDAATSWAYETTKSFDGVPAAKCATYGRGIVDGTTPIKEKK